MSIWRRTGSRSRRLRRRKNKVSFFKKILFVVFAVSLIVGLWHGTRRPEVTITDIVIEGGETVSHALIEKQVTDALVGSYMLLIPKRFTYFYPHEAIVESVQSVSRVHNVIVGRTSRNELSISFDEYVSYALWCDTADIRAVAPPKCLFIDKSGYAFAEAPELRGGALVRYITKDTEPQIGTQMLDSDVLVLLRGFQKAIADRHMMRVHRVTKTEDGDLIFSISGGGNLLLSLDSDIQNVFDNLESILGSEEFSDFVPKDFGYIDLRFGDKVYIRELPETEGVVSTTSTTTTVE